MDSFKYRHRHVHHFSCQTQPSQVTYVTRPAGNLSPKIDIDYESHYSSNLLSHIICQVGLPVIFLSLSRLKGSWKSFRENFWHLSACEQIWFQGGFSDSKSILFVIVVRNKFDANWGIFVHLLANLNHVSRLCRQIMVWMCFSIAILLILLHISLCEWLDLSNMIEEVEL